MGYFDGNGISNGIKFVDATVSLQKREIYFKRVSLIPIISGILFIRIRSKKNKFFVDLTEGNCLEKENSFPANLTNFVINGIDN